MKKSFLVVVVLLFFTCVNPVFSEVSDGIISIELGNVKVYQGDFLPFTININKTSGNASKGVISYWVESEDGKRWAYESSTLSTGDAPYSKTLDREIYIFSTQISQNYYLRVSVNFDESSTAVSTGASFYVLPKSQSTLIETIQISNIEKDITAEKGKPKYVRPKIKNTGDDTYHNVSFLVEGSNSDWFTIAPLSYPEFNPAQELSFTMEISILPDAETADYPFTLMVVTSEGEWNYHEFSLHTFSGQHELINYDINLLELEIADYRLEIQKLILEGKNATEALRFVSEAEVQIEFARQYLRSARYTEASLALSNANEILRESRELSFESSNLVSGVSNVAVIIGFVLLFVIFMITLIIYNHYSRKKFDRLMGVYATEIMKNIRREVEPPGVVVRLREGGIKGPELMEQVKKKMEAETVKGLMEKMERTRMFLESIEGEFKSGKISQDSFDEIKSKSEERLNSIKDQLGEKGVKLQSDNVVKEVKERQEEKEKNEKVKEATKKSLPEKIKSIPNKLKGLVKKGGSKEDGGKDKKEAPKKEEGEKPAEEKKEGEK
ncbi:MAG: hypothetical protein GON13_03820 [Nanoarchaeota archaeon]|nr:hypothetical protein [Nanoarchaeota archaeon]